MSASKIVRLKDVFSMLDDCAGGYARRLGLHYWQITHMGKIYRTLPKGAHGESNPEIEAGHVRKLVRFLGINRDCVQRHLAIF